MYAGPGPKRRAAIENLLQYLASHCQRLLASEAASIHAHAPMPSPIPKLQASAGRDTFSPAHTHGASMRTEPAGELGPSSTTASETRGGIRVVDDVGEAASTAEDMGIAGAARAGQHMGTGEAVDNGEAESASGVKHVGEAVGELTGIREPGMAESVRDADSRLAGDGDRQVGEGRRISLSARMFVELCGVVGALQPVYACDAARVLLPQLLKVRICPVFWGLKLLQLLACHACIAAWRYISKI